MSSKQLDYWITGVLILFCGIMTVFLVRSEYYPEASSLHQLPPRYVVERFLRYENSSAMAVIWRGETLGSLLVRVVPGKYPLIKGSAQLAVPLLSEKPRMLMEVDCLLGLNREMKQMRFHGKLQDIALDIFADSEKNHCEIKTKGMGLNEKREFLLTDLKKSSGSNILKTITGLSEGIPPVPSPESLSGMAQHWQMNASSARLSRHGDWMDVYLVEARIDANSWVKLWMSLTGELLKLESSFGLTMSNEDFFQGLALGTSSKI